MALQKYPGFSAHTREENSFSWTNVQRSGESSSQEEPERTDPLRRAEAGTESSFVTVCWYHSCADIGFTWTYTSETEPL